MSKEKLVSSCPICGYGEMSLVHIYNTPPDGETRFNFFTNHRYQREIWQCQFCGHFVSQLDFELDKIYEKEYVDATYGPTGLLSAFERIMAIPVEQSDNYQRVKRIISYMSPLLKKTGTKRTNKPTVLDVGSGLCVFPARMKKEGWECTVLDPEPRVVEHARNHIGVKAVCGDFLSVSNLECYDLITFNKVLEHVADPIAMLKRCSKHLNQNGVVYVEVPDGELAIKEGPGHEEFFIEHRYVFSMTSLNIVIKRAEFICNLSERLHEPSDKYTLWAFLTPAEVNVNDG